MRQGALPRDAATPVRGPPPSVLCCPGVPLLVMPPRHHTVGIITSMRVATWNVNGIRKRQPEFLAWIAYEQPDVVCVQETKASPEQLEDALCQLPGYCCF